MPWEGSDNMPNQPLSVLILVSRCPLAFSRLSNTPSNQQSMLGNIVAMPLIPLLLRQKKSWTGMLLGIIQSNSWSPFTLFTLLRHLLMLTYFREVVGDVQNILEDAAQKDSFIAKTHKRLSTRLGLNVRSEYLFFYPYASNTYI